jgi:hypothetical protein
MSNENESSVSPLESQLPQTLSHAEIKAANEKQWRSGVTPNEPMTSDQEERMPGLPRKPGLRMPSFSFGGISDQPEAVTRVEPEEGVITPMTGDWPCR